MSWHIHDMRGKAHVAEVPWSQSTNWLPWTMVAGPPWDGEKRAVIMVDEYRQPCLCEFCLNPIKKSYHVTLGRYGWTERQMTYSMDNIQLTLTARRTDRHTDTSYDNTPPAGWAAGFKT